MIIRIIIDHAFLLVIFSILIGVLFNDAIIEIFPLLPFFLIGMMLSAGLMINIARLKSINIARLAVIICIQYIASALIGFIIANIFFSMIINSQELALGQILHASMPSEQTTPVWIRLANGNLALGIMVLIVSSMISPFVSPALVYVFASKIIVIDYVSMLISLILFVLIPIMVGSIIRSKNSSIRRYEHVFAATSTLSALPTVMIVGSLVARLAFGYESLAIIIIANAIHFIATLLIGLFIARILRWSKQDAIVSMYNVSMKEFAVTLSIIASMSLSNTIAIPASVYGMIHMASAPLLARILRK